MDIFEGRCLECNPPVTTMEELEQYRVDCAPTFVVEEGTFPHPLTIPTFSCASCGRDVGVKKGPCDLCSLKKFRIVLEQGQARSLQAYGQAKANLETSRAALRKNDEDLRKETERLETLDTLNAI